MSGVYYPASESVTAFPTTKRPVQYRSARLMTEQNLVNIVNKLLDVDAFVITKEFDCSIDTTTQLIRNASSIEFNIHGYYFKLTDIASIVNKFVPSIVSDTNQVAQGTAIHANIHVFKTGEYEELYGTDIDGSYEGLILTLNKPLLSAYKSLKILEYDGSKWVIPEESRYKYHSDRLKSIDCGEI